MLFHIFIFNYDVISRIFCSVLFLSNKLFIFYFISSWLPTPVQRHILDSSIYICFRSLCTISCRLFSSYLTTTFSEPCQCLVWSTRCIIWHIFLIWRVFALFFRSLKPFNFARARKYHQFWWSLTDCLKLVLVKVGVTFSVTCQKMRNWVIISYLLIWLTHLVHFRSKIFLRNNNWLHCHIK